MELRDIILSRRSVRKYDDKPISDEVVSEIMDTAVWAPSGVNRQPWYFVVVKSAEARLKLQDLLTRTRELLEPDLRARLKDHPQVVKETLEFMETMGGAPVIILAFTQVDYDDAKQNSDAAQGVAAAIQNILLLAYEKGIGTCWTSASLRVAAEMESRYAEGKGRYLGMISLGYGDFPANGQPRKPGRVKYI